MANLPERFRSFVDLGDGSSFIERVYSLVDQVTLFGDFNKIDIATLCRYLRCYRAPAGSTLIVEGESGEFLLLLIDGMISVVKKNLNGATVKISEAQPGKTLGEMAVIDGGVRFASCIAATDVVFATLDRNHLVQVLTDEPQLGIKLLMQLLILLNQRLRDVSDRLVRTMSQKS